jgi:hypothetical protein
MKLEAKRGDNFQFLWKECRKCGERRPIDCFPNDRSCKEGKGHVCKSCKKRNPAQLKAHTKRLENVRYET